MSDHEHPTLIEQRGEPHPGPEPAVTEPVSAVVEVPDAVKQAEVATPTAKERLGAVRGRGVTWVRPTDLITRGASTVAGRGIEWNTAAGVRARQGLASGVRAGSSRVRRLPPLSAFGRSRGPSEGQVRSGVGMR